MSKFLRDESGASAIEYGLIAGLIGLALITVISQLGGNLSTMFGTLSAFFAAHAS